MHKDFKQVCILLGNLIVHVAGKVLYYINGAFKSANCFFKPMIHLWSGIQKKFQWKTGNSCRKRFRLCSLL